ncbi:hypothetical protein S83_001910, partial [Arachis hypogaea]
RFEIVNGVTEVEGIAEEKTASAEEDEEKGVPAFWLNAMKNNEVLAEEAFFKEHPLFVKNDFYITGESYAGYYIPALASRVRQGNKAKEGIIINLKVSKLSMYITSRIMSIAGNINVWYHKKTVRDALGVGDLDFVSCSSTVYDAMMQEWMRNLEVGIPALLEDEIQVLVYAGEEDLICNWLGNSRWVHAMEWSGQNEFGAASTIPFLVDGTAAGTLKSHGPLAFLKVNEAGHMVPMDQPKAALQMLTNWMQGKLTPKKSGANVSPK